MSWNSADKPSHPLHNTLISHNAVLRGSKGPAVLRVPNRYNQLCFTSGSCDRYVFSSKIHHLGWPQQACKSKPPEDPGTNVIASLLRLRKRQVKTSQEKHSHYCKRSRNAMNCRVLLLPTPECIPSARELTPHGHVSGLNPQHCMLRPCKGPTRFETTVNVLDKQLIANLTVELPACLRVHLLCPSTEPLQLLTQSM